jgi:predicted phage terminase large subunit-like protein
MLLLQETPQIDTGVIQDLARRLYLGKYSLVDFRRGFIPDEKDVEAAPFHHEISRIMLDEDRNFAIKGFRECAKTQYVIRAHTLHRLVYPDPKCRYIIFVLANQTLASRRLKEIKDQYLTNPQLCGNLVRVVVDNMESFEAVVMDENGHPIGVRIEAYGKGASVRGATHNGRRPDLVVLDDPQDLEDSLSETTLDKDWLWFQSDIKFLGKHTRIFLIGNNLGSKCIVERVFGNPEELNFTTVKIPIMDSRENPLWPSQFPIDFILKERADHAALGSLDIWYRERLCECISPDTQVFDQTNFRYYDIREIEKNLSTWSIFTTVDLAISTKETADFTAIVTVAVSEDGFWHVLDVDYGRYNPTQTIEAIFRAVMKWDPQCVGVETVQYQAALSHFLEKEMPRRNRFFRIEPLASSKKKELRIKMLQPRFATRSILFPRGASWVPEMESELLNFTADGKTQLHDDLIDALAYVEQLAAPVSKRGSYEAVEAPIAGSQ